MSQVAKIIEGWHLLFRGSHGVPTIGIKVKLLKYDPVADRAYREVWEMNEYTFTVNPRRTKEFLGLTDSDYKKLREEMEAKEREVWPPSVVLNPREPLKGLSAGFCVFCGGSLGAPYQEDLYHEECLKEEESKRSLTPETLNQCVIPRKRPHHEFILRRIRP